MSFVSFQQEREGELFQKYNLGMPEREREKAALLKRESYKKRERAQRRRAVCLNLVGFPSVRLPVLLSEPCAGQCHCVCV